MKNRVFTALIIACAPAVSPALAQQQALSASQISEIVNSQIKPLMQQQAIPGMAVGIVYHGKTQLINYGVADLATQRPVDADTLFELGSVSKTFTGLAGGLAMQQGIMKPDDPVSQYWPALSSESWRKITMLNLATYTAGGLPLQLPENVTDRASLTAFYQSWQPQSPAGTVRAYSNASIGLFGALAVKNSGLSFEQYMTQNIFQPLNLKHTFISIPPSQREHYAWGYKNGQPVRVTPGMLDAEAYGVKSTVADMARFMRANMQPDAEENSPALKQAMINAQSRYFLTGEMYQGLGWEMVHWPANPQHMIAASDNAVALKAQKTRRLMPAQPATPDAWVHKTGSTNGFGAYIAFIPEKQVGLVMLANKSYPNPARVEAAYHIITALLQTP